MIYEKMLELQKNRTGNSAGDPALSGIGSLYLLGMFPHPDPYASQAGSQAGGSQRNRAGRPRGIAMPDPRITKLAKILVHYSLEIQPGQQFVIETHPWAEELTLAVYAQAIRAGAHVIILSNTPGAREICFQYGSDAQLDHV